MTASLSDGDRARGVLLGLACGDALGRPVEFETAEQIERTHGELRQMVGDGTWNQPAGTVTDDTEQALCLARSLAERGRFDPTDVGARFVEWYAGGPFDVGATTRRALERLQRGEPWDEAGQRVWEAAPEGTNAGNGSLMRCAPLAVAYAGDAERLVRTSVDSSRITHADPRCTTGCAVLNLTIATAFAGRDRPLDAALDAFGATRGDASGVETTPTAGRASPDAPTALEAGLPRELETALRPVPDDVDHRTLQTAGYVVTTLQTALFDALTARSAEAAIVRAVNRGGDADTIGAVAGAVAGARFGAGSLPDAWLDVLDGRDELESLADALLDVASRSNG